MEKLISDDDLFDLLAELEEEEPVEEELDEEMEASNRRYQEIIKKHRMD
jgi:hypothetical protein